ncbi:MAG TPA: WbqC family protein [Candidatus Saccharimonadales bacterium]|nr:WbqC family protein [Candidatus Saccharimonadales bacterium]
MTAQIRYTGTQPQYFPRLHYFNRILNADVFMLRDDAQYVRKHKYPGGYNGPSYQSHTPIKAANGIQLLQIPTKHDNHSSIAETQLNNNTDWPELHLKTIRLAYGKAPFFTTIYPQLENLLTKKYVSLADLNISTISWALSQLNMQGTKARLKNITQGSQSQYIKLNQKASATEKILGLCQEVAATEYYCGGTAVDAYLDRALLEKNGIKVIIQDWACPEYKQRFMKQHGWLPNLSIIDLLMNVDPGAVRSILISTA